MRLVSTNTLLYLFLLVLGVSGFIFAFIWPQTIGFYVFIALAAGGGLGVAFNIYHTKKYNKQLICPVGSDCNAVITSRYAKFLGIPLEYCGMFYYAVIFVSYLLLIFAPRAFSSAFPSGLISLTALAFLFSLYLLFVQAFILRKWCVWCLLSAMLSIGIFIVSLASVGFIMAFFARIEVVVAAIHTLGFVLGMGGATISLFLFFRFLRDFNISEDEIRTLKGISELVWLGLIFVLASQLISFIAYPGALASSGLFLAQTIALLVVAVTGAVLMIIFAPLLTVIPFNEMENTPPNSPFKTLRKSLFVTGAVAFSSWYFAFVLNYLPEFSFFGLLLVYVAILAVASVKALFLERNISRKH